jgi:alpha-glucoside transport system permease protein
MSRSLMRDGRPRSYVAIITMGLLTVLWCIPTIGLLVTSFRTRDDAVASGWWSALFNPVSADWTTANYVGAWTDSDMGPAFLNTIVVAVPGTLIPIMFAAFAAYAFTFMDFPFKEFFFLLIIGVMVVPIQLAFGPMLDLLGPNGLGVSGQYIAVWLLHTGFGMPLCIYTLRNYMTTLPNSVVESAKVDGCSHYQTFWRLVAPMSMPAIAAFATLQFLWVWNDLLIAKLFLRQENTTVIVELQQLLGTQGQGQELLTAGAFITMVVPLVVFVSLQQFMVRGMTSGAVKG